MWVADGRMVRPFRCAQASELLKAAIASRRAEAIDQVRDLARVLRKRIPLPRERLHDGGSASV